MRWYSLLFGGAMLVLFPLVALAQSAPASQAPAASAAASPAPAQPAAAPTPTTFPLFTYWADGKALKWYSFGSRSTVSGGKIAAPPVYWLVRGFDFQGHPNLVEGQGAIFDVLPGQPGYSDLWELVYVEVPPGYVPDTIKSLADIDAAGLKKTVTSTYLDCPIVGPNDKLTVSGGTAPPKAGWVNGQRVSYFDVGPVSGQLGKMWRFATGKDAQGAPILVPGQLTVADPSPTSFRQVWLVLVADGYVANSITTAKQLLESGFQTQDLNLVVNVPLPPPPPEPEGPTTSSFAVIGVFALAFLVSATYLLRKPKRPAAPASIEPAAAAG